MNFEFVIIHSAIEEDELLATLAEHLIQVLEDNGNEFDPDTIPGMMRVEHRRTTYVAGEEVFEQRFVLNFVLELPDATEELQSVLDEFTAAVMDTSVILHLVKFEDPLLHQRLAVWGQEIFMLEMKLRRVLTLIYLKAYVSKPYELLREETVKPLETCKETDMTVARENQFFHLLFSHYSHLNRRPKMQWDSAFEMMQNITDFEGWRRELMRRPVENSNDSTLLATLQQQTNAIEAMRNCIAHNRTPPNRTIRNYQTAKPLLEATLNNFLQSLETEES